MSVPFNPYRAEDISDEVEASGLFDKWGAFLSAAHLLTCMVLFFYLFSRGMDRFDMGDDSAPSISESVASATLHILIAPPLWLATISPIRLPPLVQFVFCFANSLAWGFTGAWILARTKRYRATKLGGASH